jgi:hypothetical protein
LSSRIFLHAAQIGSNPRRVEILFSASFNPSIAISFSRLRRSNSSFAIESSAVRSSTRRSRSSFDDLTRSIIALKEEASACTSSGPATSAWLSRDPPSATRCAIPSSARRWEVNEEEIRRANIVESRMSMMPDTV